MQNGIDKGTRFVQECIVETLEKVVLALQGALAINFADHRQVAEILTQTHRAFCAADGHAGFVTAVRSPRNVEGGNCPPGKDDCAKGIIDIAATAERRVHDAGSSSGYIHGFSTIQHPAHKINIVYAAIEENTAGSRGETNKEAFRINRIVRGGGNVKNLAKPTGSQCLFGLGVCRVKAAHETDHRHLSRMFLGHGNDPVAISGFQGQRFFAENVLARTQDLNGLISMQ